MSSCDGIDTNAKDLLGQTALAWATGYVYQTVTGLLLSHGGVDANVKTLAGRTPLMIAAKGGHQAIVEFLLSHVEIDVNSKDIAGTTALYEAAAQGDKNIMKLLLAHTEIDWGSEDDKGRIILAQVEDTVQVDAKEQIVRLETERTVQKQKGLQATLKLLRAALGEREQHKSQWLGVKLT